MRKSTKVVALEQHMDSITVAVAGPGRQAPELYGDIPSTPEAVSKLRPYPDTALVSSIR